MTALQNEIKLLEKERDDYLLSSKDENDGIDKFICKLKAENASRMIRMAKAIENDIKQYGIKILNEYTNFLIKENYIDVDAITEEPTAIDQFLFINKNKNK